METLRLTEVPDAEILARVQRLVQGERRMIAELLVHLGEIDHRKLYLRESCSSLFVYCTQVLHLSEHAAYFRIEAARLARRFPAILAAVERGDVHLTALRLLAPLLTPENHVELLASARHKTKSELREIIARIHPQPDVPARVRRLPGAVREVPASAGGAHTTVKGAGVTSADASGAAVASADAGGAAVANADASGAAVANADAGGTASAAASGKELVLEPPRAPRRAEVVPLAPERFKVQFTAGAATHRKLRRAQELLRHRIPNGDIGQIIDQALDVLVHELERKKFAATDRPRRQVAIGATTKRAPAVAGSPAPPRTAPPRTAPLDRATRHIPADVKRAVWMRDQGRCAFRSPGGARCSAQGPLEFDHIRPHADGGNATIENVRLLCRAHNHYEARQFFGVWQEGTG